MRKVKFILVALVAVVVAGIAFAVNGAVPEKNQNGYLYNPATDQYITSSAVMGFEGVQFTISDKVDCGDSFGSDDASIAEAGYTYVRFKFADGTNNFMRMTSNGVVCQNSGYHKWAVKESKNGLIIRCIYTSTQSSGALSPFAQQGYYLTPDADGKLVLLEEPTEASYWEYVDPDTYQERLENEANAAIALPKIIKKAQELLDKPMSKVAKQALETALATYGEGYTGKAFPAAMALAEAYDEAVASIVAYKGILSSYEMHKSMLKDNPNALAEYEDQMADILEDLENGDIMGNGMEEMAAIAKQYFLIQDIEAKTFAYETECEVKTDYVPGGNHGITIDWDAIAEELEVDKENLKIYAVLPDETLDESYERGSQGTDGWRDAEGNWALWNSADNLFYVQFTGMDLVGVGCMRTAEPTKYTAKFKVVNAYEPESRFAWLTISLNVKEKEVVIVPFTQLAELKVGGTQVEKIALGEKPGYVAATNVDVDLTDILAAIGAESISDAEIYAVQSDGTLDPAYGLGSSDGWRNAAGDWALWGNAASQFYVKADFTKEAGQLVEIGGHPDHSGAHMQGGAMYVATYAFVTGTPEDNKAYLLKVDVIADGTPVEPAAPTASVVDPNGEKIQYFYNVEAKGFLCGANDWGTRASISADKAYPCRFEANGETYKLADFFTKNNVDWHHLDCSSAGDIWVDGGAEDNNGEDRAGAGTWTYTVYNDLSFTIANTNVAGLLSIVPSKGDTRLYMSEDAEAMSKWIAVSEADYIAYGIVVKNYNELNDEWLKTHYAVGDEITNLAPATWEGQTGTFGSSRFERYNTNSIPAGDVMTQTLTDLQNGIYEVQLEVSASYTSGRGFECPTGPGLVEVFANTSTEGISVVERGWVNDGEFDVVTLQAVVDDGVLKYGIRNTDAAGNWYVAYLKSIKYISTGATAPGNVTAINEVNAKPVAAKTIFNAAGQQMKNLQKGLNIVDGKKIYVK